MFTVGSNVWQAKVMVLPPSLLWARHYLVRSTSHWWS